MTNIFSRVLTICLPFSCLLSGQSWEVGGSAGYGLHRDLNVSAGSASGKVGFDPGVAFGAVLGNQVNRWVAGEARYTYRSDDLKVSSGSTKFKAGAQSHALHYDVLLQATSRESAVRPFLAAGAGVKFYRGTGAEPAFQPLSNLVVFSRKTEAQPLISVGGGIKFAMSRRALFRIDFRDYTTPLPTSVLAVPRGSNLGGWVHDLVLLLGVSSVF